MKQYLLEEKFISKNFSDRENKQIEYIVVHDTGNLEKGFSLDRHYDFFENVSDNSSYHYLIGNEGNSYKIYNFVPEEYRAWHCGDGLGEYGITNDNSIGISICVNEDSDYENNILGFSRMAAELLIKYNLPIDRLVRHYDASKKICPESMSSNDWELWNGFYDLTCSILNWLKSGNNISEIENGILRHYQDFCEKYFLNLEELEIDDDLLVINCYKPLDDYDFKNPENCK